jgi:putative ABC transport system permease protein
LLSLLGAVAGLSLTVLGVGWLAGSLDFVAPMPTTLDVRPDWRILTATLGESLLATLCFALVPAWQLTRLDVNADLRGSTGENARSRSSRLLAPRNLFVTGQVAISLALLVAAGLFGRGALKAMSIDSGFPVGRGFYLQLDGGLVGYSGQKMRQSVPELLQHIRALPGVESASVAVTIPFGDLTLSEGVQQAGAPIPPPRDAASPALGAAVGANYNVIGDNYFRTLGIPLLQGGAFSAAECNSTNAARVAIVSVALAQKLWPGESPLGKRIQLTGLGAAGGGFGRSLASGTRSEGTMEVVGIVPSWRPHLVDPTEGAAIFVPFAQDPRIELLLHVRPISVVKSDALLRTVRAELLRFDPILPVLSAKSLRSHFSTSPEIWMMRSGAMLFGALACSALLLSLIGVYGAMGYYVARRMREMGIRMALGADRGSVLSLILSVGAKLAISGMLVGVLLALALAKAMAGLLFEIKPLDPVIFSIAPVLLVFSALLACYVPARRAANLDPMMVLRQQ